MFPSMILMQTAIWIGALAALVVGGVSLDAGTAPEWAVLRGVGAFFAFLFLGVIAEHVTYHGMIQAAMRPPARRAPADRNAGSAAPSQTVDAEVLTADEVEEEPYEAI